MQHPTMGTGALVASDVDPGVGVEPERRVPPPGPSAVLVRLRSGADPTTALRSLRRIANELTLPMNYGVTLLDACSGRPRSSTTARWGRSRPSSGWASPSVPSSALGLTLLASVRRRRRDLALFKTLGFTRRQLASVVAWQSSVAVGLGTVVGVPLGIVFGRLLWDLFARRDQRRAATERSRLDGRPHRRRGAGAGQCGCRVPGPHRGADADRARSCERSESLSPR